MEINKKNRTDLKRYFVKNAIPTAANFADLIDATFNQAEDGIIKPPGNPLCIAVEKSSNKLINFYKDFADSNAAWSMSQSGKTDPKDVTQGNPGFSINDAGGLSRVFIESSSGNVGIGTVVPKAALDVNGSLKASSAEINGNIKSLGQEVTGSIRVNASALANKVAIDTGIGLVNGATNDYIKSQFVMASGGTVTWDGTRLKWTQKFIALSSKGDSNAIKDGYIDIPQPTADIPADNVWDKKARSANADGVLLNGWESLYAVHKIGGGYTEVSFRIVHHTAAINIPSNWLLVGQPNQDDQSIKLGTGIVLGKNCSLVNGMITKFPRLEITDGELKIGGFTSEEKDEWPYVTWSRDASKNWDEGLIKAGKDKGKFGRAGFGIHMHESRHFAFYSTNWNPLLDIQGGTGNTYVKGYVESQKVAFTAYVATNDLPNERNPLPFKAIAYNLGNGFDVNTSKFTAPIGGIYLFTVSFLSGEILLGQWLHWTLLVNGGHGNSGAGGEEGEKSLLSCSVNGVTSSKAIQVQLKAGDVVHIWQQGIGRPDNYRSSFTGVLLSATF